MDALMAAMEAQAAADAMEHDGVLPETQWNRIALVGNQTNGLGLLDVAGLRLEAPHGGLAGEPLHDNSPEYVFVARR